MASPFFIFSNIVSSILGDVFSDGILLVMFIAFLAICFLVTIYLSFRISAKERKVEKDKNGTGSNNSSDFSKTPDISGKNFKVSMNSRSMNKATKVKKCTN